MKVRTIFPCLNFTIEIGVGQSIEYHVKGTLNLHLNLITVIMITTMVLHETSLTNQYLPMAPQQKGSEHSN